MKKGAMFGLESRTLKKQFGKLFLVRMQSVGSKETRGARIQSNRAAMFGLDARIALAIFGALSVISGAALYSAIQKSKVTALAQDFIEIEKALEAMYLDTGSVPKGHSSSSSSFDANELVTSTVSGWRGPYINYPIVSKNIKHSLGSIYIRSIDFDSRATLSYIPVGIWENADFQIGFQLYADTTIDDFTALDEIFDGGDGPVSGRIQGSQADNNTATIDTSKDIRLIYKAFSKNIYK